MASSRCLLLLVFLPLLFCSCASFAGSGHRASGLAWSDEGGEEDGGVVEDLEQAGSALGAVLLYIPNRILDLFDIVKFGVNVGPGFGVDAQVTKMGRVGLMSRTSVGVGLQGLRHLPVMASIENYVAIGPAAAEAELGPTWHRQFGDIRVEPHLILVGAHVAVDPVNILDFLTGIIGIDLLGDDLKL